MEEGYSRMKGHKYIEEDRSLFKGNPHGGGPFTHEGSQTQWDR